MTKNYQLRNLNNISIWSILVILIALLIAAPIVLILLSIFSPTNEVWQHISNTVLTKYIKNSFILMFGVSTGVLVGGVGSAWLVSMAKFPGRGFFEWAHLLPMAIPAYLLAYIYTDFLQFSGPLQSLIRSSFHWSKQDYYFPAIRSIGGAIFILILALYPYVYLLARSAFLNQAANLNQAARCLSANPWRIFFRISLPVARPAIVAAVAIVLMETLSDFGTVDYFAIPTFTTGIYRAWFGMGDKLAAMKLAAILLIFVLSLFGLEQSSRKQQKPTQQQLSSQNGLIYKLTGLRALAAFLFNLAPIVLGFILPFALIINMAAHNLYSFKLDFWKYARNSLILAGSSSLIIIILAIIVAYGLRIKPSKLNNFAAQIAAMGYAIPGTVMAVSIIMILGKVNKLSQSIGLNLFLITSLGSLFYAYSSRFLTVAFHTLKVGLENITTNMDNAAATMGHKSISRLFKIHIPLLKSSIYTALILVFVDVIKELPATLIIRPFNFDTLAIQIYRLASDERLAESASAAVVIVIVGIVPVILLARAMGKSQDQ